MSLVELTEQAVTEAIAEVTSAQAEATEAMSLVDMATERLQAATTQLERLLAALAALNGTARPAPMPAQRADLSPVRGEQVSAPSAPRKQKPSGPECPGCGEIGSIVRNENYKGTPYTVLSCRQCGWERQA